MATERRKEELVRGVERCLEVLLGSLGGFELRPTRCFLWADDERSGDDGNGPCRREHVPRRERHMDAGAVHVRTLGNPLLTVALASVHAARALRERR